jgi:hypothetical protein
MNNRPRRLRAALPTLCLLAGLVAAVASGSGHMPTPILPWHSIFQPAHNT